MGTPLHQRSLSAKQLLSGIRAVARTASEETAQSVRQLRLGPNSLLLVRLGEALDEALPRVFEQCMAAPDGEASWPVNGGHLTLPFVLTDTLSLTMSERCRWARIVDGFQKGQRLVEVFGGRESFNRAMAHIAIAPLNSKLGALSGHLQSSAWGDWVVLSPPLTLEPEELGLAGGSPLHATFFAATAPGGADELMMVARESEKLFGRSFLTRQPRMLRDPEVGPILFDTSDDGDPMGPGGGSPFASGRSAT